MVAGYDYSQESLVIAVVDSGEGISSESLELLYEDISEIHCHYQQEH